MDMTPSFPLPRPVGAEDTALRKETGRGNRFGGLSPIGGYSRWPSLLQIGGNAILGFEKTVDWLESVSGNTTTNG